MYKDDNRGGLLGLVLVVIFLVFSSVLSNRATIANSAEESLAASREQEKIYKVEDFYKAGALEFIDKYVISNRKDDYLVNEFYKSEETVYWVDFTDQVKKERYLCKVVGNTSKDSKATYNLDASTFLTWDTVLEKMEGYEYVTPYLSFYIEKYNIKNTESLESVRTSPASTDFVDLLNREKPAEKDEEASENAEGAEESEESVESIESEESDERETI